MKEKICSILIFLLVVTVFGLTVCAIVTRPKEVSRHEFTTNVTVEKTYHRSSYMTPIKSGKVTTYVHHSAQNKVYVNYGEEQFMIDDKEAYSYCKNKDGEVVQAIMAEIKYENGTTRYKLLEIVTE